MFIDPAATRIVIGRCNPLIVPLNVTIGVHLRRRMCGTSLGPDRWER